MNHLPGHGIRNIKVYIISGAFQAPMTQGLCLVWPCPMRNGHVHSATDVTKNCSSPA